MVNIWDAWERSETGPHVSENDFDMKVLPKKLSELKKEFGIRYDPNEPVPSDISLAKSVFEAGVNLLCDVGIFCRDSGRIIKINEEEIKDALRHAPNRFALGIGKDEVELVSRDIEDKRRPLVFGGPWGCPISENFYLDIHYSYAKEPEIDIMPTGSLESFQGMNIKKGTPVEMAAARAEAVLAREAIRRADRPGMGLLGVASAITADALSFADFPGGFRSTDLHEIAQSNELKMDWTMFKLMMHYLQDGYRILAAQCPILGGVGGPEETAIVATAEAIQGFAITNGDCFALGPTHISFSTSTDRQDIWVGNLTILALKSLSQAIIGSYTIWTAAGPCTETQFYEIACQTIANTACGTDFIISAGGTKGKQLDHYTGMEGKIAGEVCRAATGMKMSDANEIVKSLLEQYEKAIIEKKAPIGKKFNECYDLKTITPSKEYLDIIDRFRAKLRDLGLKI